MSSPATTRRTTGGALVLGAVLLLSLNLRPAAVSVGPVLAEVRASLGLSAATAGVLTSLPVLAFALFGAAAPVTARRFGVHRVVLGSLLLVGVGLVARALVRQEAAFLVLSFVTLGGMAMANVLLPGLVRLHFPDRVGKVTSLYTTMLAVGLTAAFVLTVPISDVAGTWRAGLAAWAVLAAVAVVPWLLLQRTPLPRADTAEDATAEPAAEPTADVPIGIRDVARTRLGWAMAVFFGTQSMLAYAIFGWFATLWRDAGFSAATAGLLVGVLALASVPMSFVVPRLVAGTSRPVLVLLAVAACYPVGFAGLVWAPASLAVLWAVVVGVATSTFPIVLVLIGLRARTPTGTAALSSWTQSVGYLFSVLGPFGVGLLHGATDGWTVPLVAMTLTAVPLVVAGSIAMAQPPLEDQLGLPGGH